MQVTQGAGTRLSLRHERTPRVEADDEQRELARLTSFITAVAMGASMMFAPEWNYNVWPVWWAGLALALAVVFGLLLTRSARLRPVGVGIALGAVSGFVLVIVALFASLLVIGA